MAFRSFLSRAVAGRLVQTRRDARVRGGVVVAWRGTQQSVGVAQDVTRAPGLWCGPRARPWPGRFGRSPFTYRGSRRRGHAISGPASQPLDRARPHVHQLIRDPADSERAGRCVPRRLGSVHAVKRVELARPRVHLLRLSAAAFDRFPSRSSARSQRGPGQAKGLHSAEWRGD